MPNILLRKGIRKLHTKVYVKKLINFSAGWYWHYLDYSGW